VNPEHGATAYAPFALAKDSRYVGDEVLTMAAGKGPRGRHTGIPEPLGDAPNVGRLAMQRRRAL
jgi:hypothetical protein